MIRAMVRIGVPRRIARLGSKVGPIIIVSGLLGLAGCGAGDGSFVPTAGRIVRAGAEPTLLAGHVVETAPEDPALARASGVLSPDGTFVLETLAEGRIVTGAVRGRHRARLVLSDDDPAVRQRAAAAIPARYLAFDTSGWSFEVPESGPVELTVAAK